MIFNVKLVDKIFQVEHIYPETREFCKDYLTDISCPDFCIQITENDISSEQQSSLEQSFSPAYLETLSLLRKIADILPNYQRFLMHGASISYEDDAYLFTAPSGTGKSTHIKLWKKYLGDKVKIVNGDKPFISLDSANDSKHIQPLIYGTPWAGKERWQRNCSVPLKGICFLQRGLSNTIRPMTPEECLTMLFRQVYIPSDTAAAGATLELLNVLTQHVPLYLLTCDMSEDAVRCSFEALTGLNYPNETCS